MHDNTRIIVTAVILAAIVGVIGGLALAKTDSDVLREDAVKYGHAKYVCNEKTGEVKFTWLGNIQK